MEIKFDISALHLISKKPYEMMIQLGQFLGDCWWLRDNDYVLCYADKKQLFFIG